MIVIVNWLRTNVWASGLLTLIRLYLGWKWLTSGWGKITGDSPFDASGFMKGAVSKPLLDKATNEALYPTYNAFLEHFALPNVNLFNILVPWGEFLVGLGLILGTFTAAAAFFGLFMNFMYIFGGSVSSNPFMILLGIIVFIGGTNSGKMGLDYYVVPFLRQYWQRFKSPVNKDIPQGL